MGLLTVDEFVRSGKIPMVKNKNDVYMLIRMGGLKAVKQGRKTYIVTAGSDTEDTGQDREKRNKKTQVKVPEIVYKLIAVVANKEGMEVEQYIDRFLDNLNEMFRFFDNNQKIKEIEISRAQMERIMEKAELIQKMGSLNRNKRFQGRKRVDKYLMIFIFLLTLYCHIRFEQKI